MSDECPVVTGMGYVGAAGPGAGNLRSALESARSLAGDVDLSGGYHGVTGSRRAALVRDFESRDWIPPLVSRRMSPPSRYAVVAARMALEQAGLAPDDGPAASRGVFLSTAFGPSSFTETLLEQIQATGPRSASPSLFTECVANAPAAQIAIQCRFRGPNVTISGRESGALAAVASAATQLRNGRVDLALAGAVEEMTPLLHSVLDAFGALARPAEGSEECPRPFDTRRDGFLAAEGACVLALEKEASARARGAQVLARLRGWSSAFDASATRVGWGRGATHMARGVAACLAAGRTEPDGIGRIVSGASGSRAGDRLEARTLRKAWGPSALPPVLTPKAITGEYGGGFLGAAVLAAQGVAHGALEGCARPDPRLQVAVHDGSPLPAARRVLVSGLSSGGAGTWLLLEAP